MPSVVEGAGDDHGVVAIGVDDHRLGVQPSAASLVVARLTTVVIAVETHGDARAEKAEDLVVLPVGVQL